MKILWNHEFHAVGLFLVVVALLPHLCRDLKFGTIEVIVNNTCVSYLFNSAKEGICPGQSFPWTETPWIRDPQIYWHPLDRDQIPGREELPETETSVDRGAYWTDDLPSTVGPLDIRPPVNQRCSVLWVQRPPWRHSLPPPKKNETRLHRDPIW